jgi:hypothetical protein
LHNVPGAAAQFNGSVSRSPRTTSPPKYVFMFLSRGDSLDFSYSFQYLCLGWSFSGGEIPTFIWWFSMAGFVPLGILAVFLVRRFGRHA